MVVALLLAALVLSGVSYEQLARRTAAAEFPPPGRMLSVDGHDMHLSCMGEGSPAVILETGLSGLGSMQWYAVQPAVAELTTTCAYDRAGILWSEHRGRPRTAEQIVEELTALLESAGLSPPYIMAGHSLGGLLTRMYAHAHPDAVAGFVFIDSAHPDQLDRMPEQEIAPPPEWALAAFSATGLIRLMSAGAPEGAPASVQNAVQAHAPNSVYGLYAEMASLEQSVRQARRLEATRGSLGSTPVVVLTRGRFDDAESGAAALREPWMDMQRELAALSDNSDHRLIADASHFVHLDDPEAVAQAIRDVVAAARDGTRVQSESPP